MGGGRGKEGVSALGPAEIEWVPREVGGAWDRHRGEAGRGEGGAPAKWWRASEVESRRLSGLRALGCSPWARGRPAARSGGCWTLALGPGPAGHLLRSGQFPRNTAAPTCRHTPPGSVWAAAAQLSAHDRGRLTRRAQHLSRKCSKGL